ncbi:membrane integrity-associated transporter subunit PqiC [Salinisphaera sp. Q1T1-3]|uniref:PqiC family protein n=1 Tax=Salinisphaera sp. Q1T1-3 TaxID=2321229 RepID=UPI000E7335AA|nr:ABC-type transport auxiliary lipoprotein family protein [Salinisphaera sp. Q1T1-3]RJS94312.1 hypothetical protein D3260_04170 [Salinisphaera sp. Q1T1-3]
MTHHASRPIVFGLLLVCLALLAGCATSGDSSPSLFVLDSGPTPAAGGTRPGSPSLMVAPVVTASYLNQGGIVYQTAPHRVVVANNNRWAAPLAGQLTDTLYNVLSRRLNRINVRRATSNQHGLYQLQTRIDRFYGSQDGNAHIAGQWQLTAPDGQLVRRDNFDRTIPLASDGYPALVSSLSQGWQAVAADMAPPLSASLPSATRN